MEHIPDELLDTVFQYLSTAELVMMCARVSRRWRRVVERRALFLQRRSDMRRLHCGLRAVLLTNVPLGLRAVLGDIASRARLLVELSVHARAPLGDAHLRALRRLPRLAHLDVFTRRAALDERHVPLAARLRTLVANEHLAPGLLRGLAARDCRLVALHMYGRSVHCPARELLAALRARGPHWRELTLRCRELPERVYDAIGACAALRELRLYSCWLLRGARALCRPRRLRVLHVTGAHLLRARALAAMLAQLPPGLHELALSARCFDDALAPQLARAAPGLRTLELWRCGLTAPGAQALVAALARLERFDTDVVLPAHALRALARLPRLRHVRCTPESAEPGQRLDDTPGCAASGRRPDDTPENAGPGGDLDEPPESAEPGSVAADTPRWFVDQLCVVSVLAQYHDRFFRPEGEGFRSTLFYYWTRDIPLEPLPPHTWTARKLEEELTC